MDPIAPFLAKALRYLSFRPRSEKEIRDYLLGKDKPRMKKMVVPSEDILEEVINRLKKLKFVDDAQFAKSWVRSRIEYKPKSLTIIKLELRQRGISQDLIEEAVAEIPENKDDKILAKELLIRKKRIYESMEKQERLRKAGGFLARKGFSFESIKAAIDEVFG
jgi:regulatory protein